MQISLFLIVSSFVFLCTVDSYKAGLDCSGPNEYYACGGGCDNVCSELKIQSQDNCPIRNIRCNDKCYCKKNFARNDKGICIPIKDCPPSCPDNEEYTKDKKICPSDRCSSVVERCIPKSSGRPGCVCKPGYLRKKEGGPCIPQCECPQLANSPECTPSCPLNEEYTLDKKSCPSDRCSSVVELCLPDNSTSRPGCVCKQGYLRKGEGGHCVPICECPELANSPECAPECPLNEEYTSDKKICPSDKCSSVVERCVPKSTGQPGCVCKSGYLRKGEGEPCVPQCECPQLANSPGCAKSCPDNEEYTPDKKICPSDRCSSVIERCIPKSSGRPGCVCKPGYLRKEEGGPCVPQCECPQLENTSECIKSCPDNEEYTSDKKICPSDKCSALTSKCATKYSGKPGCVCKPGYLRKDDGTPCIPICECPENANNPGCSYPYEQQ